MLFLGYGSSVLEGQRRIGKVVVREAFHDGLSAHPVGKCVRLGCDSSSLAPNNNSSMLLLAHNLVNPYIRALLLAHNLVNPYIRALLLVHNLVNPYIRALMRRFCLEGSILL